MEALSANFAPAEKEELEGDLALFQSPLLTPNQHPVRATSDQQRLKELEEQLLALTKAFHVVLNRPPDAALNVSPSEPIISDNKKGTNNTRNLEQSSADNRNNNNEDDEMMIYHLRHRYGG